jgi:F420-0:gamma-glutamyl ligase
VTLSLFGVDGLPEIEPGADLAGLIAGHANLLSTAMSSW